MYERLVYVVCFITLLGTSLARRTSWPGVLRGDRTCTNRSCQQAAKNVVNIFDGLRKHTFNMKTRTTNEE